MKLLTKVCGLREPDNIAEIAQLNPDFMGFIFHESSPRFVGPDFRIPALPPGIRCVGVFVNHAYSAIARLAQVHDLPYVQLHGNESPELCAKLRAAGLMVIKAFPVERGFDFETLQPFAHAVDYFLFDAKGQYYGGNGVSFDWSVLDGYPYAIPFFLGGGIGPENVGRVKTVHNQHLFAVDLNSRVECAPGLKDRTKLATALLTIQQL